MSYKKEFDKYLKLLSTAYERYHTEDLSFRDKNKLLKDMLTLEDIVDNLIHLCTNNEGLERLDLKLQVENTLIKTFV